MKKLIILILVSALLFSCSKQENNNTEVNTSTGIIEKENKANLDSQGTEEKEIVGEIEIEDSLKDELIKITHNNFEPIISQVEGIDNSKVDDINCNSYFYLPEEDKRPQFQLDIQKEYIEKCKTILNEKRLIYYNEQLKINPDEKFNIKEDYMEEYKNFLYSLSGLDYNEFLNEVNNLGITTDISEEDYNNGIIIPYYKYLEGIISDLEKSKEQFIEKQNNYQEWINTN